MLERQYNPNTHHRRSIRLRGYDYSRAGAYFVTLCIKDQKCLFGKIFDGHVWLSKYGRTVLDCWSWLPHQYPHVRLDTYIIMPNHLHGIIIIDAGRGGSRTAPTIIGAPKPLGRLIGAFKTVSTKHINVLHRVPGRQLWQRNYYEHVIRDEFEMNKIREYITQNPTNWHTDRNNPNVGAVREPPLQ